MSSLASGRLRLVAALAGLNVVLAVGGWLLLVSPQRQHAASASQQTQQVQSALTMLRALVAREHAHQPVIRTADLYRLAQAMPTTADEPDLLLSLDQLAHASGVRVLGVSPQQPTSGVGYTVLPVNLSLSGGYDSLTRFLHRLRGLVGVHRGKLLASGRLLSVTSVELSPGVGKDENAAVGLDAYVFGSTAGPTSTGTTTTGTTPAGTTSTATTTTTGH